MLARASSSTDRWAPVSARTRRWPAVTRAKTTSAITLPIEAIDDRSNPTARTDGDDGGDQQPGGDPAPEPATEDRGELADGGHLLAEPPGGVEPGVGCTGGGEECRDGHHPVAGPTQHRFGGDRQRGPSGVDHLLDGEGAEHTQGDRDVDHRGDAEREVQRPGQLPCRVGQILRRERDDAEPEKREEGQGDARHDVGEPGVAGEGQEVRVEVGERRDRRTR